MTRWRAGVAAFVLPSLEGSVGFHWHPFGTRWVWLNAEVIGIKDSPYGSVPYVYSAGQTGVPIPVQVLLRF